MIKEALQLLVDLGRSADRPQVVDLPDHKVALVRGEEIVMLDKDRMHRFVEVETLASFVRWVKEIGDDRDVQIVVTEREVRAAVDLESHICDECVLPLKESAAFNALQNWTRVATAVPLVVRLLRTALDGTFNNQHMAAFRRVDFQRIKATSLKVTHAGESLGRTVEKLAQSAEGEIPETLTFEVAIFDLDIPFAKRKLKYAVDVDCDSERVGITPVGDNVAIAVREVKAELVAWLDSAVAGCLVLAGADRNE